MSKASKEQRKIRRKAEREETHQSRVERAPIYPASMWWGIGAAFVPTIISSATLFVPFNETGQGPKVDIVIAALIGTVMSIIFYLFALFCGHTGFSQRPVRETLTWIFKSRETVNGILGVVTVYIFLIAIMVLSGFGAGSQGFLAASGITFAYSIYSAIKVTYRGFYYDYFSDDPERDRKIEEARFDFQESGVDDREQIPSGPINRLVTATREAVKGDGFKGRFKRSFKALFFTRKIPGKVPSPFFKTLIFAVVMPGVFYSIVIGAEINSPLLTILPTTTVPLLCLTLWASWEVSETGYGWKVKTHREHLSLYRYYADSEIMEGINLYNTEHPSRKDRRILKDSGLDPKDRAKDKEEPEVS